MRNFVRIIWACALSLGAMSLSRADPLGSYKGMSYQEAKTWHEQFMQGNPTKAQRLNAMRELVIASPVGERGLRQIYRNFSGAYSIDPTIPNVENSLLREFSDSKAQVKGYRRELLYAVELHNDPRYMLFSMNEPLKRKWGNTDADLMVRHQATGLAGRVEVKDYSRRSQYTNLRDLKIQIDKMAREGAHTGQLQFWVNRREVIPEIERYTIRKGVVPLGNVSTGRSARGVTLSSGEAMNEFDRHFAKVDQRRIAMGAGQAAFGAWMLVETLPGTWRDLNNVIDPDTRSTQAWLRLGQSGSSAIAGGTMMLSGGTLATARFAGSALQSRMYAFGKGGGLASLAALGISESFLIARYARGDVMSQEFWTSQWVFATAGAGGMAGWWAGGLASTLLFKNPVFGAVAGSTGGGLLGQSFGNRTAQMYYDWKFGKLDQQFGSWVYAQYQVK
jgi:hypothetical protein